MPENNTREKTYQFALKVDLVCKELTSQKGFVLSRQLLRSATAIEANVEEGIQGQSKADFVHKFRSHKKNHLKRIICLGY